MALLRLVRKFVFVQEHEATPLLYSFASLFCILSSYFVLVPLREDAGISLGTNMLPKLFTASLVAVLLFAPLASAFLSRPNVPRERSLHQFYTFLAASLVVFYTLYYIAALQAPVVRIVEAAEYQTGQVAARALQQAAERSAAVTLGDPTLSRVQRMVRASFYVWVSVLNLASISGLWARCADVFSADAAARVFGVISAGATLGQLAGSLLSVTIANTVGRTTDGPVYIVILLSAMLMYAASWTSARVRKPSGAASAIAGLLHKGGGQPSSPAHGHAGLLGSRPDGGVSLASPTLRMQLQKLSEGFTLIFASRYLLMVCFYLLMTYVIGSLMYFQRNLVIATLVRDTNSRTAFFATVYSASAFIVFGLQVFATGRLLHVLGIPLVLALFPASCAASILCIWHSPTTSMVAAVEVLRKVLAYSVIRPAREVLFTVVSRDEKYKAKLCIDTVVQRMGDVGAAIVFEILDVQLSLGLSGVAAAGAVLCIVWMAVSMRLGAQQQALAAAANSAGSGLGRGGGLEENG